MSTSNKPKSLQQLLDEPKGKEAYASGQAFLLYVFWEAPNLDAAEAVLNALKRCAQATRRDTPCVPMYFFRISTLDQDLIPNAAMTVKEHPQLQDALKKLHVGVPRAAVSTDLLRRGIDPSLLDADDSTRLPEALQQKPVMLECTELYLDQRAFYEHAGSRDYLSAYGDVMKPGLYNKHVTVRLGTPTTDIVEEILKPMLKERVEPILPNCVLWRHPTEAQSPGIFLALSIVGETDQVVDQLPSALSLDCTTCLVIPNPLCSERVRILCVLQKVPQKSALMELALLKLEGIEAYCEADETDALRAAIEEASLSHLTSFTERYCGYLVHPRSHALEELAASG